MGKKKKKNRRDEFFALIPQDAKKILDVGCADGNWVDRLKRQDLEVVGIEKDPSLCQLAGKCLRQVHQADIENFTLPYPDGYFDCIIYADILEHLIDPYALLEQHKKYLRENGTVIASLPNIRHYKVILRLVMGGVWDYMPSGLLDRTHLRFFALQNAKELFEDARFKIVLIKRNIVASRGFKFLNFLCFNRLREFLTYQYYIVAVKQPESEWVPGPKRVRQQF